MLDVRLADDDGDDGDDGGVRVEAEVDVDVDADGERVDAAIDGWMDGWMFVSEGQQRNDDVASARFDQVSLVSRSRVRARIIIMDDPRIQYSIGSKSYGTGDCDFYYPSFVLFDCDHALLQQRVLYVVDRGNCRIQVFSADDGAFMYTISAPHGTQFNWPSSVAIDHEHHRLIVANTLNSSVLVLSLADHSLVHTIDEQDRDGNSYDWVYPEGVCMMHNDHHMVVSDHKNHRVRVLSALDFSILFDIGEAGTQPGQLRFPHGVCADERLLRIVVADSGNHRIQLFSALDGSFLFAFGSHGTAYGQFDLPRGVCIDSRGRILVADYANRRLQAFTPAGRFISQYPCAPEKPDSVAFDRHRGFIAFAAGHRVHVIAANQWLDSTFQWRLELQHHAPASLLRTIWTVTLIRTIAHWSSISLLPNELLFLIFEQL